MVKCPFCQSDKIYFRFEDGFDWNDQKALVNADCESCYKIFGVWIAPEKIVQFDE